MKHLTVNNEAAAQAIKSRLERLRLSNVQGENVEKVVSIVRSAIKRLKNVNSLPDNIMKILINIFSSSSVPEFNGYFSQMRRTLKTETILNKGIASTTVTIHDQIDHVLDLATELYREMHTNDEWSGASTQGNELIFTAAATTGKVTCWNCGKDHHLNKCPEPKNKDRINQNKQAFQQRLKDKKKKEVPAKYKPPTADEKNRRIIDGKPMWYQQKQKRWIDDKFPEKANVATTPAASPTSVTSPAVTQETSSVKDQVKQELRLVEDEMKASLADLGKQCSVKIATIAAKYF